MSYWNLNLNFIKKIVTESEIIKKHFELNKFFENIYFSEYPDFPDIQVLKIEKGKINDPDVVKWVKDKSPDVILLFGTGLLKEIWFESFNDNIINVHLGLSLYYKGTGTNFWPFVNWELEYLGVTILVTDLGVDTGKIITHVIPDIEISDLPYDINMKLIKKATKEFTKSALNYFFSRKAILQREISVEGKEYRRKELTEESVLKFWENINRGIVSDYLQNKNALQKK